MGRHLNKTFSFWNQNEKGIGIACKLLQLLNICWLVKVQNPTQKNKEKKVKNSTKKNYKEKKKNSIQKLEKQKVRKLKKKEKEERKKLNIFKKKLKTR